MGVYGADLSYTSVFDHTLREHGSIRPAPRNWPIDWALATHLTTVVGGHAKAQNDRDALLDVISETYWT